MRYKDKHGKSIRAGMFLRHNSGTIERVVACGEDDLGFVASKDGAECYPLSEFNMAEWEIDPS